MGPLILLFWTSGDVSSGFQSVQPYSHLAEAYMVHIPEIHLWCDTCRPVGAEAWQPKQSFTYLRAGHWWGSNGRPIVPQTNALPTELCCVFSSRVCHNYIRSNPSSLTGFSQIHNIGDIVTFVFPKYLPFPPLFAPYDVSKCEILYQ